MAETTEQNVPRLCHIKKRGHYGFSLEVGQDGTRQLCKIKSDSPAEEAGLLEGDVLIEVNGVNVEGEGLACVLQRIRSCEEITFLVADTVTDKFYKDQGLKITSEMPGVTHMSSKSNFSVANPYVDSDSTPNNGPQQINPYHAGYDQGPANGPKELNPYHVGYDPPPCGQSFGGANGPYPMIQQPRSSTVNQPVVAVTEYPEDLILYVMCVGFFFCWCIGGLGIYFAYKSTAYYRAGNFEKGKQYRSHTICTMIMTVVVGIVLGAVVLYLKHYKHYKHF